MPSPSIGATPRRKPGRPREFDIDTALDAALPVFRERGFHAASIADLGMAMHLTAGSMYKAFGDKRAIFLRAFERHVAVRDARLCTVLEAEASGFDKVSALLAFHADAAHGVRGRRGCLVAGSAMELATFDAEMAGRVTDALRRIESTLREVIRAGQRDGSLSGKLDPGATARLLLSVLQGFHVIGKTGRTRADMVAAVEQAMRLLT